MSVGVDAVEARRDIGAGGIVDGYIAVADMVPWRPKPAAVTTADLLMKTLPLTYWFACPLEPKKPAAIPDGVPLLLVDWLPELIVPAAVTAITAGLPAATLAAKRLARSEPAIGFVSLTALMPLLPELMDDPLDVVTAMLPGPRLVAEMP